ncbi:MAG: DUF6314 family protein [Sulfitobacter sp.]
MTTPQTARSLSDFAGAWRFARTISHTDGSVMQVTGTAQMDWLEDALSYHERGAMVLPNGQTLQAERRYLWQQGLQIYFDDGRFFHAVPPKGGEAQHWCPPDDYRVSYDFGHWPQWRAVWHVSGPAKSYVMRTDYQRG